MKRLIVLVVLAATVFACGTTSKVVKTSKKTMNGSWSLQEITYSDYGNFKITFFNDVSKDCIVGSNWSFVSNNNSGVTLHFELWKNGKAVNPESYIKFK